MTLSLATRSLLATLRLLLVMLLCAGACSEYVAPVNPGALVYIYGTKGNEWESCSGTVVNADPGVVLTAAHCLMPGFALRFNGRPAKALRIVALSGESQDQALMRLDITFPGAAPLGPMPKEGNRARWWGNCCDRSNFYREGYVTDVGADDFTLVGTIWRGDSGAGVFNEAGELVGVVTDYLPVGAGDSAGIARRIQLKPEQAL